MQSPETVSERQPLFSQNFTSKGLPVVSEATLQFQKDAYTGVDIFGIPKWGKHLTEVQQRVIHDPEFRYFKAFVESEVEAQLTILFEPFQPVEQYFYNPEVATHALASALVEFSIATVAVLEDEIVSRGGQLPKVKMETLQTMQAIRKDPIEWNQLLSRTQERLQRENPNLERFLSQEQGKWTLPEGWNQKELSYALHDIALSAIAILEHQATADRLSKLFDAST